MSQSTQTFENHGRLVPAYHIWTTTLLVLPTLYFGYLAVTRFSVERVIFLAFCGGVLLAAFFARSFPLGVQNRVIRLEERLRMERILGDDLRARLDDFTTEQLIGLRFASDEELPALARRVLAEGIRDRRTIKRAVKGWRADHHRI